MPRFIRRNTTMATIDIKDVAGKTVKSVELNDAVFGIDPNIPVMQTVVRG